MKRFVPAAALCLALAACSHTPTPAAAAPSDSDPYAPYLARAPKHQGTFPSGYAMAVIITCQKERLGDEFDCLCFTWNLMEKFTFDDVTGMPDDVQTQMILNGLATCHALNPKAASSTDIST